MNRTAANRRATGLRPAASRRSVRGTKGQLEWPKSRATNIGERNGSTPVQRLTNEETLSRLDSAHQGQRGSVIETMKVGTVRGGESTGESLSSPVIPSPPTPPTVTEGSVATATLARLTVQHFNRYTAGDQRSNVFTFEAASLGSVKVTFLENQSGTNLHILVDSNEARQMLQRALPNLEQEWTQNGLNFADVNVEVGNTGREGRFPSDDLISQAPALQPTTVTEDVTTETRPEMGMRHYGYNTVEFVA